MQRYIEASSRHATRHRMVALLDEIIGDTAVHARFVNTLARMEYVGLRKLLKSRRAEGLDLEGLHHMLDENIHALRLKKAAAALASSAGVTVTTFADGDTLAGAAGEAYLQALDRRTEDQLADLPEDRRGEANYLLTTAVIEVRAQVFYPIYDARLAAHAAGFSVSAIARDEERHLGEMASGLARMFADWRGRLEPLLAREEILFADFLDEIALAMAAVRRAA